MSVELYVLPAALNALVLFRSPQLRKLISQPNWLMHSGEQCLLDISNRFMLSFILIPQSSRGGGVRGRGAAGLSAGDEKTFFFFFFSLSLSIHLLTFHCQRLQRLLEDYRPQLELLQALVLFPERVNHTGPISELQTNWLALHRQLEQEIQRTKEMQVSYDRCGY